MAAVADGMAPLPLPAPRSVAASLARALSRLAPLAADAVLCLCLADIWLLFAGAVAVDIARITGTEDRAAAVAASKVVAFSDFFILHALVFSSLVFLGRLEKYDADEVKGPVPRRLAAAKKELKCYTVMLGLYACVPFFLLMMAGALLLLLLETEGSPMKGSHARGEAIAFAVLDVGQLGKNALGCFVIVPTVALKVWRVTRPGWRGDTTVEKNA